MEVQQAIIILFYFFFAANTETFCANRSDPENSAHTTTDNSGTSENSDNTVIFMPHKHQISPQIGNGFFQIIVLWFQLAEYGWSLNHLHLKLKLSQKLTSNLSSSWERITSFILIEMIPLILDCLKIIKFNKKATEVQKYFTSRELGVLMVGCHLFLRLLPLLLSFDFVRRWLPPAMMFECISMRI